MEQRFGKKSLDFQESLKKMGKQDGINFTTEGKIGNTRDAHRLIQLGKAKGDQVENQVVMELFRSYFEEAGDITSHDMLIDVAGKAGLDREETREWLAECKGGQEVDAEVEEANAKGLHGVPSFTIQGKYEVDGAQAPEAFFQALVDAKEGN
jgi:predicted DsbA family dithiol-disulfide isomerase